MCFNEYVSFGTFIVGTILNLLVIFLIKTKEAIAIALIWEWVLLMQLFEGFVWVGKKSGNKKMEKYGVMGAYIANVLQPVIAFLLIAALTTQNKFYLIFGGVLIGLYLFYTLYVNFTKMSSSLEIGKSNNCRHLNYKWWDVLNPIPYILVLVAILLLAKPYKVFLPQLVFILLTLFLASITQLKCGAASTWCFLAAFAPILTLIQFKLIK